MKNVDIVIIGGGSAGLSAAIEAKQEGIDNILILERGDELGGILQQCIHNGFGLQTFHEELSGPMYAQRFIEQCKDYHIPYKLQSDVIAIDKDLHVTYVNKDEGYKTIQTKTIVLACGCYERTRGAISIPGERLPGIYTAGSAQRFLNLENICVGKKVFILGSGDIGLIMARRFTLEGSEVVGVAEIMPYSNGLNRNIVQCLNDFDIPLYLSHTVIDIEGTNHVERVVIAQVDENKEIIPNTEKIFEVDTLLLSVGLIPEMALVHNLNMKMDSRTKGACVNECFETSIPHIYACGNALHVHDIVDFVTAEAKEMAHFVVQDLKGEKVISDEVETISNNGISYVLPQRLSKNISHDVTFSVRVKKPYKNINIVISSQSKVIKVIHKRYALPSEMIRFHINQKDLSTLEENLQIEVQEL